MHAAPGKLFKGKGPKRYKAPEWRYELINQINAHACMQLRASYTIIKGKE
jgi:hypothetical protein